MNYESILRRAKRNNLPELAGDSFRDINSEIVVSLRAKGKDAFLGIQNAKGLYTIIGKENVYILTDNLNSIEIPHKEILIYLQDNGLRITKGGDFEFVPLGEGRMAWF